MLLEKLFENLAVRVENLSVGEIAPGDAIASAPDERPCVAFVLRGEGTVRSPTAELALGTYAFGLIPPGVPHRIRATSSSIPLLLTLGHIDARYAGTVGLFDALTETIALDFSDSDQMRTIFDRMLSEQREAAPGDRAMMRALLSECLVLVFRRMCEDPDCQLPWLTALDDPGLAAALRAILDHPDQHHTIASLAERALMSRSTFAERFHVRFGRPPMTFVRDVRLRRAADLLRTTTQPVDAVASRAGFTSRSSFSRAFRELFGETPGRFRGGPTSTPTRPVRAPAASR